MTDLAARAVGGRRKMGARHMDGGFIEMAERLATEFTELPDRVVIRALTGVHDEYPGAGEWFVEEAVRARLAAIRQARLRTSGPGSVG